MSKTVIALFDSVGQARKAADALKASGFTNERIEVQNGEEFIERGALPPAKEHEGLYRGIKAFFAEIGLTAPDQPQEGEHHVISPANGVILLQTSDERADQAAAVLDREGAVEVEERGAREAESDGDCVASGLEPATSGKTPPGLGDVPEHGDIDERSLAGSGRDPRIQSRRTRVYGPANEPYGDDWAPKGPNPH